MGRRMDLKEFHDPGFNFEVTVVRGILGFRTVLNG